MKYIFFFVLLSGLFISIDSHIMIIPFPYYNRDYPINNTKSIALNGFFNQSKNKFFFDDSVFEFFFTSVFFNRSASRAYDLLSHSKNVSTVFHGKSEFDISDMHYNAQIPYISDAQKIYKDVFSPHQYIRFEGSVCPKYFFEEQGCILGLDIVKKQTETVNFALQIRLPLIRRIINHENNWKDISFEDEKINDERVFLEPHNKYFQVRADYLFEQEYLAEKRGNFDIKNIPGMLFKKENSDSYFLNKIDKESYIKENINELEEETQNIYKSSDNYLIIHRHPEEYYAVTEFDEYALPTENSLKVYEDLNIIVNRSYNPQLYLNIIKGIYVNKNYSWHSIKTNYLAPCDIQCNIIKLFNKQKIIFHGLVSLVLPIQNNNFDENNYLEKSIFRDQYAFRIGSQISFDINTNYKLVAYGSYQYYFPKMQTIPSIFENQEAYGLLPLYLKGKVSWSEWYFAGHLVVQCNEYFGGNLGYQYIKKLGDSVVPECNAFYSITGEKQLLDYSIWKKFTSSIAQLMLINIFFDWQAWQLNVGLRGLIQGRNIMQLLEYSLQLSFTY